MDILFSEVVDPADLKKFEHLYLDQLKRGSVSSKAQFEYSWCLVRSKYQEDIKKGVALLIDLFQKTEDESEKRDYLFYLSVGHAKISEYDEANRYVKAILTIQPQNHQAQDLQKYIKSKMRKEGLMGMAIVGGAALAIGGLITAGIAIAKK